jgi:hypothetical protein
LGSRRKKKFCLKISGNVVTTFAFRRRWEMRKHSVLSLVFVFFLSGIASADFIQVHSQEYSIEGYAHYYFNNPNYPEFGKPFTVGYQETSSSPVSQHTTWPEGKFTGRAYAESSAGGEVTSNYAWVKSSAYLDDMGDAISEAFASASITFSPLVEVMRIVAERSNLTEITLIDLTLGTTLYSYSGFYSSESIWMYFDPSHIYSINTKIDVGGTPWINFGGSLRIESIPEPATILLLGAGLIGLGYGRKRLR